MTEQSATQGALEIDDVSPEEAPAVLEALLFASGEAVDTATLAGALGWSQAAVQRGLALLEQQLSDAARGLALQRAGDQVQLITVPRYGKIVARLLGIERQARISSAALDTLALIAYRQPVTRSEIEAIRGVDSSGVVATLVARELVEARGRRSGPGAPVEYGTTDAFLKLFGLTSLEDLPPLSD